MSERYTPSAEGGLAYDDPRLGLDWPLPVTAISARDRSFQPLAEIEDELRRRMLPELSGRRVRKTPSCRFKCGRSELLMFIVHVVRQFYPGVGGTSKECRLHVTQAPCLVKGTTLLLMPSASNACVVVRSSAAIIFKAVCTGKQGKKWQFH